jgi:hypothetical protein
VRGGGRERGDAGLAATYSSAAGAAVPSALRVFTAEFGMGSGVWLLAMATRPAKPAPAKPVPAKAGGGGRCHVRRKCLEVAWGKRVLPLCAAVCGGTVFRRGAWQASAWDQGQSSD